MNSIERVQAFLGQKRFALIGVSRQPNDFSRAVWREFLSRGYDVAPVNPEAREIDGRPCFASVGEVTPAVEGALLMTSPAVTDKVVRECAAAGIRRIWLYRAVGTGAVTPGAVAFCEANGLSVVAGECPLMFLPGAAWFHRVHALVRRITRSYPR
jgi:predicted CoA-binding protein